MTNEKVRSLLLVSLASFVMLVAFVPAKAQTTATFNLTSVGSGLNLAGVYTSPYSGSINGGSTIPVICDDFADDSFTPESWTAYITQGSSLLAGTTDSSVLRWSGATVTISNPPAPPTSVNLTQVQAYEVAAVLAIDILNSSSTAQEDYSYALWALFDPTDALNQLTNNGDATDAANATIYLDNAVTFATTLANASQVQTDLSEATIYSYDPANGTSCNGGSCPPPPQEFITVNTPEPSAFLLLALGVVSAMLLQLRKSRSSALLDPFSVGR